MFEHFKTFRALADSHQVIFFYTGTFSQPVISAMAESLKSRLTAQGLAGVKQRRVYSTFIEMAQNIVHYSADAITPGDATDQEQRNGQILIAREGENLTIVCGNRMNSADTERLSRKLEVLRSMSHDEIKTLYKHTLRAENEDGSKGAGLGFLTVARDACEPIDYRFVSLTDTPSSVMFYLKAII